MNNISQLCPFLRIFKSNINTILAGIPSDAEKDLILDITTQAKEDLAVWSDLVPVERSQVATYTKGDLRSTSAQSLYLMQRG